MGQNNTRPEQNIYTSPEKDIRYEEMDLDQSIMGFQEDIERSPCCSLVMYKPKAGPKPPEWKHFLLKRFEKMQGEDWPLILLRILNEPAKGTLDNFYQTELLYACYNDPKYAQKKNTLLRTTTETELKDRQTDISASTRTKKPEDQSDLSPLRQFDERDYSPPRGGSWMEVSYNIKGSEEREAMMDAIGYLKDIRNSVEPLEATGTNLRKLTAQKKLASVYQSRYDNYTVLFPTLAESPSHKQHSDEAVKKYKNVFRVIEGHLKSEDNIFCRLIKGFEDYYVGHYTIAIASFEEKNFSFVKMKKHIVRATLDLQQFIGTLYESISLFYKLEKLKTNSKNSSWKDLLTRDNVLNFITSIVLTEKVYKIVFELYSIEEQDTEQLYQKNISLCGNFNPEDFGVPEEYCLNDKTVYYLEKKALIPDKNKNPAAKISFQMEEIPLDLGESFRGNRREELEESKDKSIQHNKPGVIDSTLPYYEAIVALSELRNRRSPIHKIKTILKAAELISKSIEDFYLAHGITNKKRLDADQTLSLFLYLVSKSGLSDVSAHYKIVEKFTTNNVLNSTSGYYATTMGACVACICSMDLKPNSDVTECRDSIRKFIRTSGVGSIAQRHSMGTLPRQSI